MAGIIYEVHPLVAWVAGFGRFRLLRVLPPSQWLNTKCKEADLTDAESIAARPAASVVSNRVTRHGYDVHQPCIMSYYRLGLGAAAVLGAQALPVPELVADHLEPGESLTLSYDLRSTKVSDAAATIFLRRRGTSASVEGKSSDHAAAQLAVLSMCVPGYRLQATEEPTTLPAVSLAPGYSALSLGPDPERHDEAKSARLRTRMQCAAAIRLPVLAPWAIRVDRLLEALIDGGRHAILSVELIRVRLGQKEVRLLARAREALRARAMSLPAEGSDATLVRFQIALLQGWALAQSGVSMSCRLGFDGPADQQVLKVAADMLFGPRPQPRLASVNDTAADLDLSLAFASMMKVPVLLPPAAHLDSLGFFSRRRWRADVTRVAASCRIGSTLDSIPVSLAPADLGRHVYVIGATGVGKSTLMARMIHQDIDNGLSTVVVDPHGDLFQDIADGLSKDQRQRACIADLSVAAGGFGLDLLDMSGDRPDIRLNFVCNQLIAVFRKVLYRDQPEGFGPMFEAYFRYALMLQVLGSTSRCTLSDFDRVFGDPKYRADLLANCQDDMVVRFWKQTALRAGGEAALENIAPYIISKLTQFTGSPLIRPIIDGSRRSVDFGQVFDEQGILLINLAKGVVGETDAALVGALFSIDLFSKALLRSTIRRDRRSRVRLYLDEFQTYASDVLSQMLAECRKFGLELVLANQSLSQISGFRSKPDVADAILANVGTVLAFRTGPRDARQLEEWFAPNFDAPALMRLPDHSFVARLLQNGLPIEPFIVHQKPLQ